MGTNKVKGFSEERFNRRTVLQGGLALSIGLSAGSLGVIRVEAADKIGFWYATNPSETDFAKDVVAAWNESQDLQVDAQPVPAGNSTEEVVLAAIAAKTTPCALANLAPAAVPQFGQGLLDLSAELDDADSFLEDRSSKEVVDQYRSKDGDLYQIPWKVNPVMVFYNTAMFEKAGLDPKNPPKTYSEALDAMNKLKSAGITAIQPSIDQTWYNRWFDWYPLYLAAGNQLLLNEDATKAIFNNDAAKGAMEFWREVYEKEYAPMSTSEQDSYSQGKVAMRMAGPWAMADIEKGGILDDTAVMPVWVPDDADTVDEFPNTFADTKNIGIFSNCDDKDAAWEFVKFYISEDNDKRFFEMTQQIPLRQGIDDAMGEEFFTDHPLLQPFAQQAQHTLNVDLSPKSTDIFGAISQAYQKAALYDKASVEDALNEAESKVNSLIS